MNKSYGIVGAGWRAEFFLRISRDLPEQFPLAGIVVRDKNKRAALAAKWRVPVFAGTAELLAEGKPAYVVTSVPWAANLPVIESLVEADIPVLSETPAAPQLADLKCLYELARQGARIQVAEQYLFQPLHAARLKFIGSGRIGTVREATVSVAHGYHGLSLLRHYLGTGMALPSVTAWRFKGSVVNGPGRGGAPAKQEIKDSERVVARLDFGDKLGIYDFTGDQYFSWIRAQHLLLRGEKGEIQLDTARYLKDFKTPKQFQFQRRNLGENGNLEGYSLESIQGDGEIFYRNPFMGARWSDDEIAVATSLLKMQKYAAGGPDFYSVAEACQDRYLDLMIDKALASGKAIKPQPQAWNQG